MWSEWADELYGVFSDSLREEEGAGWWRGVVCLKKEEECDCNYVGREKKEVGSDLLESRRTEGAPVDFISSLVKAGVNITHWAPSESFPQCFYERDITAAASSPVYRGVRSGTVCTGSTRTIRSPCDNF